MVSKIKCSYLLLLPPLLTTGCSCSNGSSENYIPSDNGYEGSERGEVSEPENPYEDGSGHSAGYEWAKDNQVSYCGGNSQSFINGCEEYLR